MQRPLDIPSVAVPYWEAFQLLSRRRTYSIGMGGAAANPIPVSEIRTVAPLFGFLSTDIEFVEIVAAADDEWLKQQAEASKKNG